MARGATAKIEVINKIKSIFGTDYIGEEGSKYYVWANDGGERVQIAISLTCPKNQIAAGGVVDLTNAFSDGLDFEAVPVLVPQTEAPAEVTQEEQETLAAMMARLGL